MCWPFRTGGLDRIIDQMPQQLLVLAGGVATFRQLMQEIAVFQQIAKDIGPLKDLRPPFGPAIRKYLNGQIRR